MIINNEPTFNNVTNLPLITILNRCFKRNIRAAALEWNKRRARTKDMVVESGANIQQRALRKKRKYKP